MNEQSRNKICTNPATKNTINGLVNKGVRIINNFYDEYGKLLSSETANKEYCRKI